jgi:hypothetical protein
MHEPVPHDETARGDRPLISLVDYCRCHRVLTRTEGSRVERSGRYELASVGYSPRGGERPSAHLWIVDVEASSPAAREWSNDEVDDAVQFTTRDRPSA